MPPATAGISATLSVTVVAPPGGAWEVLTTFLHCEATLHRPQLGGAESILHVAWCKVQGAGGAWCMVHGERRKAHGAWCMVHDAWCMDGGQRKKARMNRRKVSEVPADNEFGD